MAAGKVVAKTGYAIVPDHGADDIVAVRGQRAIRRAEFEHDVATLAAGLPAQKYLLNLFTDRYRFMVGLAAGLHRQKISLLPPSDAPAVLSALTADYPDLCTLADDAGLPSPGVASAAARDGAMPPVPGEQPALVLFTSGSTGKPKPVKKSWGALVRSACSAGARLGVAGLRGATLVGTVPHQHSYGLESIILLGLLYGLRVDAGWYLYPGDIRAAIERAARPRILVTTPVHLRVLLAEPEGLPRVDLVLSATAPLPVRLAVQAEAGFAAPLIEIYGCTEAGQVATRRTARDTHWQCLDGVELHTDAQGTWARGPAVEATALLHDVIEPTGAGTFLLGARSADLVNVAGKRTSLAHLNHQLLSIPGVRDGVFLMGKGRRVARLTALVVAPELGAAAIMRALRERIDTAFLPRPLLFVPELPRNTLGKLHHEAVLQLAGRDGS